MARRGENIRKRVDGRWEGRYPVFNEEKGKKEYRSVYGKTYEMVKEKMIEKKIWLKEQEARKQGNGKEGNLEESEGKKSKIEEKEATMLYFSDMAEKWLNEVQNKKKWSTYIKYRLIYQNHLKTPFQDTSIAALPEQIEWEKRFTTLSDSVRKSIYCVLNQILKFVSGRYLVPLLVLKRPVFHTRKKPVEVLSKKDQARLFSALYQETDRYKMAVLLCMHTGLRLGELCALKWTDIDFGNGLLVVNRTVQRIYIEGQATKTILMETLPKSEHSRREIPLPPAVLEMLARFKKDKKYIFGEDKPLEPRTLQNHFKKILKEAGAADKSFHVLRHTFSTNCIEGGTDVKSLSEILGHSDVQITLNRYVHPSIETKRRYLNALCAFYGQIYGQAG